MNTSLLSGAECSDYGSEPRRIEWPAVLGVCLVAALVYVLAGGPLL